MHPSSPSQSLFTDLYELTMAQAYWQSETLAPACFSFFFRKLPPNRSYLIVAGLADVLAYLRDLRFTRDDIEHLRSLRRFRSDFLAYLNGLRFTGSVRAMAEGQICFADEPVLEVTAPVIEAQLAETFIVNQLHLQSVLATKASRVRHVAPGKLLVDFAARRTHGLDAANKFARASYLAGFDGTSNTLAGVRYGIPVFGTMAHSFITSFRSEIDSFRAFADAFPEGCTLLIDTYDTIEGARRAIVVAGEMKRKGQRLTGVRLDSGDIADLARHVRAMLDEAGLRDVTIFVSGGMDEFEIQTLLSQGAPIDGFGVGTKVGVSADAPYGDCAYKMVAYDGRPVLKLSPGKQTLPGPKQVLRYYSTSGSFERDEITVADAPVTGDAEPLLAEVMRCGKVLEPEPTLQEVRRRFDATFARLPAAHKLLSGADVYPVSTSDPLRALSERLVQQTKAQQMMQD